MLHGKNLFLQSMNTAACTATVGWFKFLPAKSDCRKISCQAKSAPTASFSNFDFD